MGFSIYSNRQYIYLSTLNVDDCQLVEREGENVLVLFDAGFK